MSGFSRLDRHRAPPFTRATQLGASKHDLERDSGFSDASSEYLSAVDLTDSEDAGRKVPSVGQDPNGVQVAVMGGSYTGLSPMIIMNNFVLKQPTQMAPTEKQWGFPSPLDVMPPSQVVLLQPMVSNCSSNSSPKTGPENIGQSKSYRPILKSYPKIAPQPDEALMKGSTPSRVKGSSSSGYDQRQRRHHHGHGPYSSPSPQTPSKALTKFEVAANQSAQTAECQDSPFPLTPYTDECRTDVDGDMLCPDSYQDCLSSNSDKFKRFSNTYNILNKCGLLGITMRTKQLIKENKRTQGQLQQLQEQTALLLEALDSGDPRLWTKLQLSLEDTVK
ncbi:CLOCK-interacting pacemaker a [Aulostomus maculatus]